MDKKQRMQEFTEAIKPIHDWLVKYGNPYTTVMVTQESAKVTETFMGIPLEIPD